VRKAMLQENSWSIAHSFRQMPVEGTMYPLLSCKCINTTPARITAAHRTDACGLDQSFMGSLDFTKGFRLAVF